MILVVAVVGWWVVMASLMVGCDRQSDTEGKHSHLQEPYHIGEIEITREGDAHRWASGDEQVSRWVYRALDESEQGISRSEQGMQMRATVHHQVRLDRSGDRLRLLVEVDALAERSVVENGAPMVLLAASANYAHPISLGEPSEEVLRGLSRTMKRQAIEDVVTQLRLRAQIRQSDELALVNWIQSSELDEAERLYAIRRGVAQRPAGIDDALSAVATDDNLKVAIAAARGLYDLNSDRASYVLMSMAQRMSRDKEYDQFLGLLPLLGKLDAPWVSIYLETVADAHRLKRVRDRARDLMADRPPVVERN